MRGALWVAAGAVVIGGGLLYALQREEGAVVAPPVVGDVAGTRSVELFFPGANGDVASVTREVVASDVVEEDVRRALEELATGGASGIAPLPKATKILNVFSDGEGEVVLNFSGHLRSDHPGGSDAELATVRCIVSTVGVNFPGVDRVRILIDGETVPTLAGHVSLREALRVSDYRETRKVE
jgi:spore germination protein GerM